jgi:diguanylate cyclase (GGDEF)-like protein
MLAKPPVAPLVSPYAVPTTLTPPFARSAAAAAAHPMPAPFRALAESRAGVAKAWLLGAVEAAPLDEIERLPVPRIAADLPQLVADLAAAASGSAPTAGERGDLLDRLAALRGDESQPPLVRDLGALHEAMLGSLERQASGFDAADLVGAAKRLAGLFADLQADAAERSARSGATLDALLSGSDRLTGLHGQGFLKEHLRHLVSMQKRYDQSFALLLVDVEGLKRINQAWGERAGDDTLVGVAGAVQGAVRTADTAVRMDEDEFCVLLPHQTAGRARGVAGRLAQSVEQVRDPGGGELKIAIGVVGCPQHADTVDDLLEAADRALYRAKAAGETVAVGPEELGLEEVTGDR